MTWVPPLSFGHFPRVRGKPWVLQFSRRCGYDGVVQSNLESMACFVFADGDDA